MLSLVTSAEEGREEEAGAEDLEREELGRDVWELESVAAAVLIVEPFGVNGATTRS